MPEDFSTLLTRQRAFFAKGETRNLSFRREGLKRLYSALQNREAELLGALRQDLGKSCFEGFASELGLVLHEIRTMLRMLPFWARPHRGAAGLINFPARGRVYREPYGVVLIIAPWNYPLNLCLLPLVGALAAGNCVVLKTSESSPHTSRSLTALLEQVFPPEWVQVVEGRPGISERLLQERFDYIFFTGSPATGRKVMQAAARYLTPVTLELGGKSPCLVLDDYPVELAARRIVWGKCLNAGQTCVGPDYVLVSERRRPLLVQAMRQEIRRFFGPDPLKNPDYPRIISEKHFHRLLRLMETGGHIACGGTYDAEKLKISPTILTETRWDHPIMQEEIFGPVLPVLTCDGPEEMIRRVQAGEKPLALYLFTLERKWEKEVLRRLSFGGGCVNDTIMHLTGSLPFGGVGNSGMGRYHGRYSFLTFSHEKSVLKKSSRVDIPLRYPPYRRSLRLLRRLF